MHIESENYDFLMYILNAGKPVPSLYTQYYRTGSVRSSTLRMRALRANVKPAHCKFKGRTFSASNSVNACFLATTDHPLHFDGVNAC